MHLIISLFIHDAIIVFIAQQEAWSSTSNYIRSLEFTIHASGKTTTFQQSIETILPPSVPNWQRRSEEDPGLPITSISGDCAISLLRLQ